MVIVLIVTPQGFPLSYEVMPGNASDKTTLLDFLAEIEQAFKELKHDLAIRPVFHQREERIEAHVFVAFIAYCLHVTLKNLARPRAPGLTPRAVLEKLSTMQLVDVHLPTTDGRHLGCPAVPTRPAISNCCCINLTCNCRNSLHRAYGLENRSKTARPQAPCSADLLLS